MVRITAEPSLRWLNSASIDRFGSGAFLLLVRRCLIGHSRWLDNTLRGAPPV